MSVSIVYWNIFASVVLGGDVEFTGLPPFIKRGRLLHDEVVGRNMGRFKGDDFVEGVVPRFHSLIGKCENQVDVDVLKTTFAGKAVTLEKFVNGMDSP